MRRGRAQSGVTLVEMMVVVGIMTVALGISVPLFRSYVGNQRVRAAARSVADAFSLARAEAIRTGDNHVVYLAPPGVTDPAGNDIEDASGNPVPALVLDDGRPATSNCVIDGGEPSRPVPAKPGVLWGAASAAGTAPGDPAAGLAANGVSFRDPNGNATTWVLFRPDGIPVGFSAACATGGVGSGAGSVYVTNGRRDYAVTLAPLGGVRVYVWDETQGDWLQ